MPSGPKPEEEEAKEQPKAKRTLDWGSFDTKTLRAKTDAISDETAAAGSSFLMLDVIVFSRAT